MRYLSFRFHGYMVLRVCTAPFRSCATVLGTLLLSLSRSSAHSMSSTRPSSFSFSPPCFISSTPLLLFFVEKGISLLLFSSPFIASLPLLFPVLSYSPSFLLERNEHVDEFDAASYSLLSALPSSSYFSPSPVLPSTPHCCFARPDTQSHSISSSLRFHGSSLRPQREEGKKALWGGMDREGEDTTPEGEMGKERDRKSVV